MVESTSTASYNANTTNVSFSWPPDVNGLERILLSAQGNLQQMLSAYFNRPILVEVVDAQTFSSLAPGLPSAAVSDSDISSVVKSASYDTPITQVRRIHLRCADKIVCTASSTVSIRSTRCAQLVLGEKYAIGQTFTKLGQAPTFELIAVGFGEPTGTSGGAEGSEGSASGGADDALGRGRGALWRRYRVSVPEFECEILEAFASRQMFNGNGVEWLDLGDTPDEDTVETLIIERRPSRYYGRGLSPVAIVAWFIALIVLIVIVVAITRAVDRC